VGYALLENIWVRNPGFKATELWSAGGSQSYVYTEDWRIAKMLIGVRGRCAIYFRGHHPVAWQFRLPKHRAEWIVRKFTCSLSQGSVDYSAIENERLTDTELDKNELRSDGIPKVVSSQGRYPQSVS